MVNVLNATLNASLQHSDIGERLRRSAAERFPGTPDDLASVVRAELEMYGTLARDVGLQKQ